MGVERGNRGRFTFGAFLVILVLVVLGAGGGLGDWQDAYRQVSVTGHLETCGHGDWHLGNDVWFGGPVDFTFGVDADHGYVVDCDAGVDAYFGYRYYDASGAYVYAVWGQLGDFRG